MLEKTYRRTQTQSKAQWVLWMWPSTTLNWRLEQMPWLIHSKRTQPEKQGSSTT